MAVLTNEYQYLGRSNAVGSRAGYNYYILLYAKTSGSASTGKHTVTVKQRLVCDVNSSWWGYCTSGYITVNGISATVYNWEVTPNSDWNGGLTEGGYTYARYVDIKECSVEISASATSTTDISISASWVLEDNGQTDSHFPYCGMSAAISINATLPALSQGVIYIDNGTSFDAYQIWIDNGSGWDLYEAYIDNGSGWDKCC